MQTPSTIEVSVNGEHFEVASGSNITGLLNSLKIARDRVAVELNKNLVRRRDWDATVVTSGARVEVVEFVGGG